MTSLSHLLLIVTSLKIHNKTANPLSSNHVSLKHENDELTKPKWQNDPIRQHKVTLIRKPNARYTRATSIACRVWGFPNVLHKNNKLVVIKFLQVVLQVQFLLLSIKIFSTVQICLLYKIIFMCSNHGIQHALLASAMLALALTFGIVNCKCQCKSWTLFC